MFAKSFDSKFSRVACAFFELHHLPLPSSAPKKYFIIFQNKILQWVSAVPCKLYKLRVFEKTCKSKTPYYFGESYFIAIYFSNKKQSIIIIAL